MDTTAAKKNASEHTFQQHGGERHHRHPEFETADMAEPRDLADVDQTLHGDEDDRGKDGLRQVLHQIGQEDERVAAGHLSDRATDHQRDRRGRPHREMPRRAEQRVSQPAEQIAVDPDLRW